MMIKKDSSEEHWSWFPLDRGHIEVAGSFDEADAADRRYWHSQTPQRRLLYMEYLRRINYGTQCATQRLQRVLEFAEPA